MFRKVLRKLPDASSLDPHGDQGFVLPAVLVVMLLVSAIAITALRTGVDEHTTGRAMRESAKAFYAAEAGVNAVIAAWDNAYIDSVLAVPGDSVDLGWQTLENSCSYRAMVRRVDDGSRRKLYQVNSTGRGSGGLRGERTLAVVMSEVPLLPTTALTVNGNIKINGDQAVQGPCGGIHVNGSLDLADTLQVDGDVTFTDSLTGSGVVIDSLGNPITPELGDSVDIPQLNPWDYCGEADYFLRNGYIVTVGPPTDSSVISSEGTLGWKYNSTTDEYNLKANEGVPGTVCVNGNVNVSAGTGTMAAPLPLTILTDGSLRYSGSPLVTADHSDGILAMAEGDVSMHGNIEAGGDNFDGLVYAGSECDVNGTPILNGQVICRGDPDPPGAIDLIDDSMINGGTQINFACQDYLGIYKVLPIKQGAWSQFAN